MCDRVNDLHDPVLIAGGENGLRFICKECKEQIVIRLDERGIPEKRQYAQTFARHTLQPSDRLWDKYYGVHARKML